MERAERVPTDVERAVVIEQADTAPLREFSTEPEVLVQALLLRHVRHDALTLQKYRRQSNSTLTRGSA